MASNTKPVGGDKSSVKRMKSKHAALLLDLWSSSDDEEASTVVSHVLVPDTPSPAANSSTNSQVRTKPSLETGEMVHRQPTRGQDKIATRTKDALMPRYSLSKAPSRPKTLMIEKHKVRERIDSLSSSPPAARKASPVLPRGPKQVTLTDPLNTRLTLKTAPADDSDDSTEEDSDSNSGHTSSKRNFLKDNSNRQFRLQQSNDKFRRLGSSSSSDAESGATRVKDDNSCLGATVGRLLIRREWTNSKCSMDIISGSCSSSSSDSESLLSPKKSNLTLDQRNPTTAVPGKWSENGSLLQRASLRLQCSQDSQERGRCKRGLSKSGSHVPRFKRAKKSPTFGRTDLESLSSSSSDTESEASLSSGFKEQNRTLDPLQRSKGGTKAFRSGPQSPSPEKVMRKKMVSLFGRTSSEEGQDTTEEDVEELGDKQEKDNNKEALTSKTSVSSTGPTMYMSNLTGQSRSDNRPGRMYTEASTQKEMNSFSKKDDSVILVDITQSLERGAVVGQSRPLVKEGPFTKDELGDSQNVERMSPVFPRQAHTRKKHPVRQSNGSVFVGNVARDVTDKSTCDSYPYALKRSRLVLVPSLDDGTRHSLVSKPNPLKEALERLKEKSKASSSSAAEKLPAGRRELSEVKLSSSQGQLSSTNSQDEVHFPSKCFEEKRLQGSSFSDWNKASAASDTTGGSSITIFRKDFFMKPPKTDKSPQSSSARNATDSWACGEQAQSSSHALGDPMSLFASSSNASRMNRAIPKNPGKPSQSFDLRNSAKLSTGEDYSEQQIRGATEKTLSSSSSGLNRRTVDRHAVITKTQSRHDTKRKTNRVAKHSRGDTSHSSTASQNQIHNPEPIEVESRQTRQHTSNEASQSTSSGSIKDPFPDIEVLESRRVHQHEVSLPRKAKCKTKYGATSGLQDARQKRHSNNATWLTDSQGSRDTLPDAQEPAVQTQEARRSVEGLPLKRKSEGAQSSESVDSTDIDVVELVRQLDEDERMAKQLQEHFDEELARLTQGHNQIMSSHDEIVSEPILIPPELPAFPSIRSLPLPPRPPPLFPPHTQAAGPLGLASGPLGLASGPLGLASGPLGLASGPLGLASGPLGLPGLAGHPEMTWRDDLVDMNPMNAAMMAEMGRFLDSNMEHQAGYSYRGRQRRSRVRGRGRSRARVARPNPSDGSDYERLWNLAEQVGQAVTKGLPESSINLLPTFRYTTSGQNTTENECSICMGDYEAGENMRRLPCFHFYHAHCIDKWLKDNRICPVCREEINFEENFT